MEYKELAKLYHANSSASRDTELTNNEQKRRSADSTFSTGFTTPQGELFLAVPRELSILNERALRTERKVSQLIRSMPPIASNAVMRSIVLDEVVSTNSIEDIHSTRRQIKDALESERAGDPRQKRFKELAMLYLSILEGSAQVPTTPEDIRTIYDKVMDGELEHEKRPDGKLFRKEEVSITAGGVRVLHEGLQPESAIVNAMEAMLRIVEDEKIPSTYAALVSHYIFEYAHPFYDGNGRTGRYLLSLFLSEPLSAPTVLSLSRTIAENRDVYYKAFQSVENPLNRGELTFFVYTMLELVRTAQLGIIERLEESKSIFQDLNEKIETIKEDFDLKPQQAEATFILMQYDSFGLLGDVTIDELARYLEVGRQMARKHMGVLEEKGIVEKWSPRKPLSFALAPEFKERYGIQTPDWRIPAV